MSKSVLIVEKDLALMKDLREGLQGRGFEVEETTDGKGAPELVRRQKPGCVVLAVDLDAGQNGYIICKKLKSDDDLKGVPVIIIGDPKGFGQHQKLKTRAEEYLGKPLDPEALVDGVGKLIGFPEVAPAEEAFDPGSLLAEDEAEISLDALDETGNAESDLAMVDSMFDEKPAEAPPVYEEEISLSTPDVDDSEYPAEKTVVGFMPPAPPPLRSAPFHSSASALDGGGEDRELRAKVTELTGALEESRGRSEELEARVRELESDLESKATELETVRAAPGKADSKDLFALRDAANKKDKEILRLKNELNAKEQEVLELHEKENTLEQQLSEGSKARQQGEAIGKGMGATAHCPRSYRHCA